MKEGITDFKTTLEKLKLVIDGKLTNGAMETDRVK